MSPKRYLLMRRMHLTRRQLSCPIRRVAATLRRGLHQDPFGAARWRVCRRTRNLTMRCRVLAVRPEGANHLWRKKPPRELSIDLVADERLGRVTGRAGAS
jgi:hypothetical protein